MTGEVKSFYRKHGYGFLTGKDGTEYFFHILQWKGKRLPTAGELAEFNPIQTEKGMRAENIRRVRSNG